LLLIPFHRKLIRKQTLRTCVGFAQDTDTIAKLEFILSNNEVFEKEILAKHISVLDLLELHQSINLPFSEFLASLTPTRLRHYSIASSPLASPSRATITYGIISGPALSGHGNFAGVTGTYLSTLRAGDKVQVSVRPSAKALFKLLLSTDTPLLMLCSGTGLAPFRGFIQHRAIQQSANPSRPLAPALLFVGCRSQTKDRLYAAEFDAWRAQGVVDIRYSFSREKGNSDDCAYVQDRLVRDQKDVLELWEKGARVYVCGSGGFVKEITHAAKDIMREKRKARGEKLSEVALETFFQEQMAGRTATDVFG
jgi:cytochrome P450/NADPH-cytochrome P450 reductase